MQEQIIRGLHNAAKVFTHNVDAKATDQIRELCNQEFVADSSIRIMPDVHAGAGCTIGTTMTIGDKIVPNLVGVDIGCGMECVQIAEREIDVEKLDGLIKERIPAGFNIRDTEHPYVEKTRITALRAPVNIERARRSLGTLGGGNHFIEADRDDEGHIFIVVHSGSRHMGLEIANHYQELAWRTLCGVAKPDIQALIQSLKDQGRSTEIQQAVKKAKAEAHTDTPKALAYVTGENFDDYIHDMEIAQEYATLNRRAMIDTIVCGMGLIIADQFTTIHNYIDTTAMILRKGAVSAQYGERLLIPINMRDGSLICRGKGNPDWNYSAPHGAGRLFSRTAAKREFSVEQFREEMTGVYSTTVGADTLDECPMAYKGMEDIIGNIDGTAEVQKIIKPIFNFKASDSR